MFNLSRCLLAASAIALLLTVGGCHYDYGYYHNNYAYGYDCSPGYHTSYHYDPCYSDYYHAPRIGLNFRSGHHYGHSYSYGHHRGHCD